MFNAQCFTEMLLKLKKFRKSQICSLIMLTLNESTYTNMWLVHKLIAISKYPDLVQFPIIFRDFYGCLEI